jgi:uncharacterized protein YdaU (DUF1376 family)
MMQQHKNDMELARLQEQGVTTREQQRENRKDERIKMEGTQQSKMIAQRKNDSNPINFEMEGKLLSNTQPQV